MPRAAFYGVRKFPGGSVRVLGAVPFCGLKKFAAVTRDSLARTRAHTRAHARNVRNRPFAACIRDLVRSANLGANLDPCEPVRPSPTKFPAWKPGNLRPSLSVRTSMRTAGLRTNGPTSLQRAKAWIPAVDTGNQLNSPDLSGPEKTPVAGNLGHSRGPVQASKAPALKPRIPWKHRSSIGPPLVTSMLTAGVRLFLCGDGQGRTEHKRAR